MEAIFKKQLNGLVSCLKKIICFSIVLFVSYSVNAQEYLSPRKQALKNIEELKNGILLMRLPTGEHVVKAYKEILREDLALEAAAKIAEKNKLIADAFKTNFTFCPVYFFYSNYSEFVRNNEFGKVILLNSNLNPDSSLHIAANYFIAEFATIEADTAGYWEFYTNKNPSVDGNRGSCVFG